MANMYSMETLFPHLEENKDFLSKQIIPLICRTHEDKGNKTYGKTV